MQAPQALTAFLRQKLQTAQRHQQPFPHLIVPKLLPTALLRQLGASYPRPLMRAMPAERTGNVYAHRHRRIFNLDATGLKALPAESRDIWRSFHAAVTALAPELLSLLPAAPANQRCKVWQCQNLATRIDLWEDSTGYQILPHSEAPHKLANFLLYLTEDPDLLNEGTALYVPRDKEFRCWSGRQHPRELFELHSKAAYKANLLFGFRKTDCSFHGKEKVHSHAMPRRTISITIQERDHFVA